MMLTVLLYQKQLMELGKDHAVVFGVIIGTGTGGGISINQKFLLVKIILLESGVI